MKSTNEKTVRISGAPYVLAFALNRGLPDFMARPNASLRRSPYNPSFQTVTLPGFSGYALYPSAQVADG